MRSYSTGSCWTYSEHCSTVLIAQKISQVVCSFSIWFLFCLLIHSVILQFHFIFVQINSESPTVMKNVMFKLILVGQSNFRVPHQAFPRVFQFITSFHKHGNLSPKAHNRALLRFQAHLADCRAMNESISSLETECLPGSAAGTWN